MALKEHKYINALRHKKNGLKQFLQRKKNKRIIRSNLRKQVFAVEISSEMGIGAKLVWVLEMLAYCHEKELTPYIKFTHPTNQLEEDFFGSYFEIRDVPKSTKKIRFATMRGFSDLDLDFRWDYNEKLNLELADRLIDKYLIVKEDVLDEVEKFQQAHFDGKNVLGVHYRGTDKKSEARLITYETVKKNINLYIRKYPETDCIFVSSDEENFIKYIEGSSVDLPVIYNQDSFRSSNDQPVHNRATDLYQINREAILNALLLSRCNTLMKTASILSDWSMLFNPELQLVLLSKPYDSHKFFPGNEFYNRVLFEPIE